MDILHNLESLLQERELKRSQQRSLQASAEFIIRFLRDVWPVRQYQTVALKSEICWREMLQCLDALYSGEINPAEPSVFNMPLRTGNTRERLVSTGVILASSHEPIGERSTHQSGKMPSTFESFWWFDRQDLVWGYLAQAELQHLKLHENAWREVGWDIVGWMLWLGLVRCC